MKATTPFQRWFDGLLEERDWGVREGARRLGLTASTVSLYRAGKMLPNGRGPSRRMRSPDSTRWPSNVG